jgi:hypothetical protein
MDHSARNPPFSEHPPGPASENDLEVALLNDDPGALIARYQEMFRVITLKFVGTGYFRPGEVDDTVQSISLYILTKISQIRAQYNGSTLLKTYVSGIVKNHCIRLGEAGNRRLITQEIESDTLTDGTRTDDRVQLREAIERFRIILAMFDEYMPKLLLALKIYYRIPITREDMRNWFPGASPELKERFVELFHDEEMMMERSKIFEAVHPLMNRLEKKRNAHDAFRHWTWIRIDEVIRLLNSGSKKGHFDRETLRELVEDYFSPFLAR